MSAGVRVIRVTGSARARGEQIGAAAANEVRATVEGYREVFAAYADLSWADARGMAQRYLDPIRRAGAGYLEEMAGIAAGAGLEFDDILAINCRTEIMFSGLARKVLAGEAVAPPRECTAFAVTPPRAEDGATYLAQNWDWLEFSERTLVCIGAEQENAPDYLTVVEAGLLAKAGMNDAGIGVVTTALVSSADRGAPGLPYHVALRAMLDARTLDDARNVVTTQDRASSANYLVASADGTALNLECLPGDAAGACVTEPVDGWISHANHFVREDRHEGDIVAQRSTDTFVRQHCVDRSLRALPTVSLEDAMDALRGHENYPQSVCMHLPQEERRPLEDSMTVFSIVMDVSRGRAWLAVGTPCTSPFMEVSLRVAQEA